MDVKGLGLSNGFEVGLNGASLRVVPIQKEVVEIFDLWVPPELRGTGLGKMLLRKTLSVIKERGYTRVQLHVAGGNIFARRLYASVGFLISDEELHLEREL